jgi:hypothetical protein
MDCVKSIFYYERKGGVGEVILPITTQNEVFRKKQIKEWKREWKWEIIKRINPQLIDLPMKWFSENGKLIPTFVGMTLLDILITDNSIEAGSSRRLPGSCSNIKDDC